MCGDPGLCQENSIYGLPRCKLLEVSLDGSRLSRTIASLLIICVFILDSYLHAAFQAMLDLEVSQYVQLESAEAHSALSSGILLIKVRFLNEMIRIWTHFAFRAIHTSAE